MAASTSVRAACVTRVQALAARCPGWQQAQAAAIDVFAVASARLYDEIARQDPQPFEQCLASVADAWVRHRRARSRS